MESKSFMKNNDHQGSKHQSTSSDEEEEDVNSRDRYWPPPLTDSLKLIGCSANKTVCALASNSCGTALSSGGYDFNVNIFEFEHLSSIDSTPTYTTQPCGHHIIKTLDYSKDDNLILVVSGNSQAKVISKNGLSSTKLECAQGYQYMRDLNKTKGHTCMLNDGCWNKRDQETFITCSNDCTIRIWNVDDLTADKQVIKARSPKSGLPVVPNVCRYSRDHLLIAAGCNDGSILMWDTRKKYINTSACVRNAHNDKSEITSLDFSYSNSKLISRSCDDSCKLWDLRNLKVAQAINSHLPNDNTATDARFSPDDKTVITGKLFKDSNSMVFLDSNNLETKNEVYSGDVGIIKLIWGTRTNQIAVGCTDGSIKVYFDEKVSIGGAMLCGSKVSKKRRWQESVDTGRIMNPHALPQFKQDVINPRTASLKDRLDPVKSRRPELPVDGRGHQGRLTAAGSTLSSYIAKKIARPRLEEDNQDNKKS